MTPEESTQMEAATTPTKESNGNGNGLAGVMAAFMATTNTVLQAFAERLGVVEKYGLRIEALEQSHEELLKHIDERFDQHNKVVVARLDELEAGRVRNQRGIEEGIQKVQETQTKQQAATERRLLIAEGALASYVAGEQHRRERNARMERAIYAVGTGTVTPLWLYLLEQFLSRTHTVNTLGSDVLSVCILVVILIVAIVFGYRLTTVPDLMPSRTQTSPTPPQTPPDTTARLP